MCEKLKLKQAGRCNIQPNRNYFTTGNGPANSFINGLQASLLSRGKRFAISRKCNTLTLREILKNKHGRQQMSLRLRPQTQKTAQNMLVLRQNARQNTHSEMKCVSRRFSDSLHLSQRQDMRMNFKLAAHPSCRRHKCRLLGRCRVFPPVNAVSTIN